MDGRMDKQTDGWTQSLFVLFCLLFYQLPSMYFASVSVGFELQLQNLQEQNPETENRVFGNMFQDIFVDDMFDYNVYSEQTY